MDGGEADAVNRRFLGAGEFAVVGKDRGVSLALGQGRLEGKPHAEILLVARHLDGLAAGVLHARQVERVVQLEAGRGDVVVGRREAHRRLGG